MKSLFNDNIFISIDDFNAKFGAKINTLSHRSLKKIIESNLLTKEGSRLDTSEQKVDSHWIFTMSNLFLKNKKGSKIFRHVLNYGTPVKVNYNIDRWKKKLRTNNICESEIISGYRGMQTKIFPREFLDFKARLLLGKTKFGKTLPNGPRKIFPRGAVC